ncbi:hypothetical protein Trisim1_012466 [Trichoderma cf. simile WF8]
MLYTIDAKPPSSTLLRSRHLQNNFPEQRQADVPPPSPPPPKNPRPPGDTPTTPLAASAPAPACDSRQPPALSPRGGVWPIRAAGPKGEGEGQSKGKGHRNRHLQPEQDSSSWLWPPGGILVPWRSANEFN